MGRFALLQKGTILLQSRTDNTNWAHFYYKVVVNTSLSLFHRYDFGRCSSELAQLIPLHFSRGRSTRYSDWLHDFSVTISRFYKDSYVNSFFPHTAWLWDSLPIDWSPWTYELKGFMSRIDRHLLTVGSF